MQVARSRYNIVAARLLYYDTMIRAERGMGVLPTALRSGSGILSQGKPTHIAFCSVFRGRQFAHPSKREPSLSVADGGGVSENPCRQAR